MSKSTKIPEKFIYEIWKNQNFDKKLCTVDGKELEILDRGEENVEFGGPDFKNARIKIDGLTYVGDIEIDGFHSDWRNHGHNINKRFCSVILHVIVNNESDQHFVYTKEGRKVETVCIASIISQSMRESIQKAIVSERDKRISRFVCEDLNHMITEKEKLDFLFDLGLHRFRKKIEKMFSRLKEIKYISELKANEPVINFELPQDFYKKEFAANDFENKELWEQLFYELIFDALGYSKNQNIMTSISRSVTLNYLREYRKEEKFVDLAEAILFSVAGLIPNPNTPYSDNDYFKGIKEKWGAIKNNYYGATFDSTNWHFMKTRPQNFPTLRLSGGARLINRIINENLVEKIINTFLYGKNEKSVLNSVKSMLIVKGDGFWSKHFSIERPEEATIKYFIGASRADEMIVNVVLPFVLLYFETFNKKELAEKTLKYYSSFIQISENSLVKEMSELLHLNDSWKRSILYQGMIDLFRNYCSKNNCLECKIGKEIFN
jgi:hypothetical protein